MSAEATRSAYPTRKAGWGADIVSTNFSAAAAAARNAKLVAASSTVQTQLTGMFSILTRASMAQTTPGDASATPIQTGALNAYTALKEPQTARTQAIIAKSPCHKMTENPRVSGIETETNATSTTA